MSTKGSLTRTKTADAIRSRSSNWPFVNELRRFGNYCLTMAALAVIGSTMGIQLAYAGAGWGDGLLPNGSPVKRPTFYANSPSGARATSCFDAAGNAVASCDTGTALRKFVDPLPNLGVPGGAGTYIGLAAPDLSTYPGSAYYEVAVVEYTQQMHSDLVKPTRLRGYVQIDPIATDSAGASRSAPVSYLGLNFASQAVPLTNNDGTPVMIARPDGSNGFVQRQAYGWDKPTYLGGTIVALRGTPTRVKFYNGLPPGLGFTDSNGVFHRNGDFLIPTDRTLQGAGDGPVAAGGTHNLLDSAAVLGPYDPANPAVSPFYHLDATVPAVAVPTFQQYTQNRQVLHLHGGDNAWISDGHPHQWIAPASDELGLTGLADSGIDGNGQPYAGYRRGQVAYNVPDMPEAGPGAVTYYWPGNQSGRLMMYHDHASGITRLNPYVGTAAGFLLVDATELGLMTSALGAASPVEAEGIPLVIQDKTFVPKDIAVQDARWDTTHWGSEGDLWYPHVYETNQDPDSLDGTNPVGRWDWAPYFWPVFPSLYALPDGTYGNETTTPEAFMDTAVVNGMAYPTLTVDPKAYRFRVLTVGNDRNWNLGLYIAADKNTTNPVDPTNSANAPKLCDGRPNSPTGIDCTEVKMVRFAGPNNPTTTSYACPDGITIGQRPGDTNAYGSVTQAGWTETSTSYPVSFPCAGGLLDTGWGQQDNRPGGVPDPATMGPPIIKIGAEAGIGPQPVVIPSTPINYEYNKRSVTVLNVLERGLWMGAGVRADVVIDFSQYAGKTLILYNDSGAPVPAGDPRIDFYTGNGDQTGAGGAPSTLPGFGPNTRTVMQIQVSNNTPAAPFNVAALAAAMGGATGAYAASQPKPVVPMAAYSTVSTGYATVDTPVHIYTGAIYLNRYQGLTFTTPDVVNYTRAPTCTSASTCLTAIAAIKATGLTSAAPGTSVTAYLESKAIQELFEPDYGRMNATLGVELPFTSALTQTTIPLAYVDPATEIISPGETQFWKITHNGVDSHPVHFHMLNVQVINRVGWDGTIKMPTADELGWKEIVLMHPLEDIVVAVRAKATDVPFGQPHSYRLDAPFQHVGDAKGFTQVDPITGNPAVVSNKWEDFLQEFVWHCHILGHEENDFMRPFLLNNHDQLAPSFAVTGANAGASGIQVAWNDPTPPATSLGLPTNEIGFRVERAAVVGGIVGAYAAVLPTMSINAITQPINTLANATLFSDTTLPPPIGLGTPSAVLAIANSATQVTVTWTAGGGQSGYNILRDGVTIATGLPATATSYVDPTVVGSTTYTYQVVAIGSTGGGTYSYRVVAVTAAGTTNSSNAAQVTIATQTATGTSPAVTTPASLELLAPTNVTAQLVSFTSGPTADPVLLNWTDNSTGETAYRVQRCTAGTCGAASASWATVLTLPANSVTGILSVSLSNGTNYRYRVAALNGATVGPYSATVSVNLNANPAAPSGLVGVSGTAGAPLTVNLTWADNSNNNASFTIQRCTGTVATCGTNSGPWNSVSTTVGANATTFTATLPAATTYRFRIRAVNGNGNSAWSYTANVILAQ